MKKFLIVLLGFLCFWSMGCDRKMSNPLLAEIVIPEREPDSGPEPGEVSEFKVVGYVPATDGCLDKAFEHINWSRFTHVNICFLKIKEDGTVNDVKLGANLIRIRDAAREAGAKVLVSVQKNSPGEFACAIRDEHARARAVQGIIEFAQENKLDGFDIDYEEYENWRANLPYLVKFAKELHARKPEDMMMTCAVNPRRLDYGQEYAAFYDLINIMSYRGTFLGSESPAQHAPYEDFVKETESWNEHYGVPKEKIMGGLPFYGVSWSLKPGQKVDIRYSMVIQKYGPEAADVDEIDKNIYNGRKLIERKCRFIKDHNYGGVMIWQVLQDAYGLYDNKYLLIDVIHDTLAR